MLLPYPSVHLRMCFPCSPGCDQNAAKTLLGLSHTLPVTEGGEAEEVREALRRLGEQARGGARRRESGKRLRLSEQDPPARAVGAAAPRWGVSDGR